MTLSETNMCETLFSQKFELQGGDFNNAGMISTEIKAILKELKIPQPIIRRTVIATFEAEMNVVMYADKGTIELIILPDYINIKIEDKGQGIEDITLAIQEGYSTATEEMREKGFGAGMGLPNIKRNSDVFNIESDVGTGTLLDLKFSLKIET